MEYLTYGPANLGAATIYRRLERNPAPFRLAPFKFRSGGDEGEAYTYQITYSNTTVFLADEAHFTEEVKVQVTLLSQAMGS